MSVCVSRHGEYSSHEHGSSGDSRFVCQLCGVFDEEAALRRIVELEELTKPLPVETIEISGPWPGEERFRLSVAIAHEGDPRAVIAGVEHAARAALRELRARVDGGCRS